MFLRIFSWNKSSSFIKRTIKPPEQVASNPVTNYDNFLRQSMEYKGYILTGHRSGATNKMYTALVSLWLRHQLARKHWMSGRTSNLLAPWLISIALYGVSLSHMSGSQCYMFKVVQKVTCVYFCLSLIATIIFMFHVTHSLTQLTHNKLHQSP